MMRQWGLFSGNETGQTIYFLKALGELISNPEVEGVNRRH